MGGVGVLLPSSQTVSLVGHLVAREQRIRYRRASLGMLWALAQPLVRFGVMAFVFGYVVRLDVEDYPLFLFTGIVAWTWFAAGITEATTSVLDRPELTDRPGLSRRVIPLVAIATALVDMLLALPILLGYLAIEQGVPITALALPIVIAVQGLFIVGLGLLASAVNVYYRDAHHVVDLLLAVGFYATPIVYPVALAPESFQKWLDLNPMTWIVEAYRSVLIEGALPDLTSTVAVTAVGVVVFAVGWVVYGMASPNFGDEL
jgi:ABC-type polysaccharide/polyol phosphate export permease